MRKISCYVDFHLRGPGVRERTDAFQRLVLILMLLQVIGDEVTFVDVQTGAKKSCKLDWNHVYAKVAANKMVGG